MTPREFLSASGKEINFDNESDDCDLTWSQIERLLSNYAEVNHLESSAVKEEVVDSKEQEDQSQLWVEMLLMYEECNNKLSTIEENFHITRKTK